MQAALVSCAMLVVLAGTSGAAEDPVAPAPAPPAPSAPSADGPATDESSGSSGTAAERSRAVPAPVGIEHDLTLHQGEWMLSYRYERASFNKNRSGTRRQSVDDVLARGFSEVPTDLDVETHLLGVHYAPHERLTLRAELPLVRMDMKSRAADGNAFTMRSRDAADLKISGLWHFQRNGRESLFFDVGISAPTGSTAASGDTPSGHVRYPYPLQIGSGTFNFHPGAMYRGHYQDSAWGVRADGTLHLGRHRGYRRGNRYQVNGWLAHEMFDWLSASVRLGWSDWKNVKGSDDRIDEDTTPAGDPNRQGGARLDLGPGIAFAPAIFGGQSFAVEATWPLYQSLDGPQLEEDWRLSAGWRWRF